MKALVQYWNGKSWTTRERIETDPVKVYIADRDEPLTDEELSQWVERKGSTLYEKKRVFFNEDPTGWLVGYAKASRRLSRVRVIEID